MNIFKQIINKIFNKQNKQNSAESNISQEKLDDIMKEAMYTSMIRTAYELHKNNLKEAGLDSNEINSSIAKKEEMLSIVDDTDEKNKFLKDDGHQTRMSSDDIEKSKTELKKQIANQQASRTKSLKNKTKKEKKIIYKIAIFGDLNLLI